RGVVVVVLALGGPGRRGRRGRGRVRGAPRGGGVVVLRPLGREPLRVRRPLALILWRGVCCLLLVCRLAVGLLLLLLLLLLMLAHSLRGHLIRLRLPAKGLRLLAAGSGSGRRP